MIDSMMEIYRYLRRSGLILAALLITAAMAIPVVAAGGFSPSITWNKTFSPEENCKFDAVAGTADGGYIVLGSALTDSGEDLLLIKTDGRGGEVWMERFPGMAAASVAETSDGGYIAAGYNVTPDQNSSYQGSSLLIRTDAAGKEVWRQVISGEKVSAIRPTADGGYAVVGWLWDPPGSSNDTTSVITKTDGNGMPLWNRTFPGAAANAGVVTADGGYIIGGTKSPFTYDIGDAFLVRLDAGGNTLWEKNYAVPVIFDVKETADDGIIYSGNFWYGRVDAKGGEVWIRNMEGRAGYAVALRPAGGYMIAGTDIRSGEAFAIGTDGDGAIQWNTTIPGARAYAADSSRDGYILAGIRLIPPVASAAWLAGLDEVPASSPAAPGFCAIGAGAALLVLLFAGRKRRE